MSILQQRVFLTGDALAYERKHPGSTPKALLNNLCEEHYRRHYVMGLPITTLAANVVEMKTEQGQGFMLTISFTTHWWQWPWRLFWLPSRRVVNPRRLAESLYRRFDTTH